MIENPEESHVITSPDGQIYVQVDIKQGSDITSYTEDVSDSCLEINGLGSDTVEIERIGEGPDCKDIGGIGLYYED